MTWLKKKNGGVKEGEKATKKKGQKGEVNWKKHIRKIIGGVKEGG